MTRAATTAGVLAALFTSLGVNLPAYSAPDNVPLEFKPMTPGRLTVNNDANTLTIRPGSPLVYTIGGDQLTASVTLAILKSKACTLVVLEDTPEKIVIGCRKELTK